jgi:predicted phage terminase large subunit-like protein
MKSQEQTSAILMDFLKEAKLARLAEKSLMEFTKQSWDIIEPGVQFRDNWHLHAIAEHLEAVSRGEIENLVIAIPPGCMKSILVSVAFPAWEWIKNPSLRYMGASYGVDLAIRDSMKCRDIITSDWYTDRWPQVSVRAGDDQKTKYSLTGGGWRMATSVGGRATGEHPDRKIVDDPHNAKQAESDAERETAITWFDRTLSTRGKSRGARTIVVAQRFHERDVTGHILADIGGYDYLCIPMEFESKRPATSIGWVDPRKNKGDLLWPEMFNDKAVTSLKQLLGSYGAAGQLQQEPAPVEDGMLNIKGFKMWPFDKPMPQLEFVIQSYDTAFTEKTTGDPSANTTWGVFTLDGVRQAMLLDAWDEHLSYPDLRQRLLDEWLSEYGGSQGKTHAGPPTKARRPDRVLIEAKASGQSLLQDLRRAGVPVIPYNPGNADKVARAHQMAPVLDMGLLWIPESKKNPGQYVSWAQPMLKQMSRFPVAEHDDLVDTVTQAIIFMKDNGLILLPRAIREDREPKRAKKQHVNPYAA